MFYGPRLIMANNLITVTTFYDSQLSIKFIDFTHQVHHSVEMSKDDNC